MNNKHRTITLSSGDFGVILGEESVLTWESYDFFETKKEYCSNYDLNLNHSEVETMEFFLSLHLVLEIGVNTFFRKYYDTKSNITSLVNEKEVDNIAFLDKIRFFLFSNKFTFKSDSEKMVANESILSLIKKVNDFNHVRNMIVHGHTIKETVGKQNNKSALKLKLESVYITKQISNFKDIIQTLNYFIDKVEFENKDSVNKYKSRFLNADFLK